MRLGGKVLCRVTEGWAQLYFAVTSPVIPLVPLGPCPSLWGGGAPWHWGAVPGSCCVCGIDGFLFAHSGLRATAKITYQAVLLENLVCLSVLLFLFLPMGEQGMTVPSQTSPIHEKQLQGAGKGSSGNRAAGSTVPPPVEEKEGHVFLRCWTLLWPQQCCVLPCRE